MADRVEVDEDGVTARIGERVEQVRWDDLAGVAILTTDQGPFVDDMFWVLGRTDDTTVVVPSEAQGTDVLLARLQRLPGFDNEAVVAASACVEDGTFLCWRRD